MHSAQRSFRPVGFWAPRSLAYTLLRPRLWRTAWHRPVSVRCAAPGTSQSANVISWSYDPAAYGPRLCLEFANETTVDLWRFRWRTLADALWKLIDGRPEIRFHDIPVDVSDCADGTLPADVFRFARRPGEPHELLPNPQLLKHHPLRSRPLPWDRKRDSVFFRGSATGTHEYGMNRRVAACRAARAIPGGDCKLTTFTDAGPAFRAQADQDGIVAQRDKPSALNHHRYLLDVDGHTSSWDRFRLIGECEGVPIRFETEWEECWHGQLFEGGNFVAASRSTLADVIESLRASPSRARAIATEASRLARNILCPAGAQRMLEEAWLQRMAGQADRRL